MGDEKWILYNNVEWKRLWGKWNEPPPTTPKSSLHPKKVMLCIWWDWKGVLYYELLPENQMINSNKYCSQLDQLKAALDEKCLESVKRKCIIFHQGNARPHVSLMTRQKLYSLAGKFWFICHIHQTLHLWISIYFGLYKILLMEKISIPWKTVKSMWNSSLFKKIKSFGKMELWSCLKNGRRYWNKRVNSVFNIILGENEKCVFYFYLKTEGTFWPTQYLSILNIHR